MTQEPLNYPLIVIRKPADRVELSMSRKRWTLLSAALCFLGVLLFAAGLIAGMIISMPPFQATAARARIPEQITPPAPAVVRMKIPPVIAVEPPVTEPVTPPAAPAAAPVVELVQPPEPAAGPTDRIFVDYSGPRYPYALRVGSFKNVENARKQVQTLTRKGLPVFMVDEAGMGVGAWAFVYVGQYESAQAARAAAERFQVDAQVARTPYAIFIGSFKTDRDLQEEARKVARQGFAAYPVTIGDGRSALLVGAFSSESAAIQHNSQLKAAGIDAVVVSR